MTEAIRSPMLSAADPDQYLSYVDEPGLPASRPLRCRTVMFGEFKHMNFVGNLAPILLEGRFNRSLEAQVATPSETLLAALGSCLSAHISADALAADIAVHSLAIDVTGEPSIGAVWEPGGQIERAIGFESIRVSVHIESDASPEVLRAMVAHAAKSSPVANTLHAPVHLDLFILSAQ
jgi:uncharacterized OsmC-like protein